MASFGFCLVLALLGPSPGAVGAAGLPPYVRTQLDDAGASPRSPLPPRHIRSTLDDASHGSFPLENEGRLIRINLDDAGSSYGHLGPSATRARIFRTALD